ncbi:MAG TPA: sensor histidine kinase [Terriglobales bacterium]|nr:sensor histidine kinase [Terriglobales bacterium]
MKRVEKQRDEHKPGSRAPTRRKLLREPVAHLRRNREQLRTDWARRIQEAQLLTAMSKREIYSETEAVYDNYLEVLETGSVQAMKAYAQNLSGRIIPRGVETHEVLGIVLLLRDVLARSLFKKYHRDMEMLERILDAYEPAANRIANTVGVSFVEERERIIRQQREAMQILNVQEEERKRISRELHDEVGQALTAINMKLAVLQRDGAAEAAALLSKKIADIGGLLVGAMASVHKFARELRPTMLDELGLVPALRSYLKDYAQRTGLPVRFRGSIGGDRLSAEQKTALFRVFQESLTNVAKHAGASRVDVSLRTVNNCIWMRIKDNGRGFVVHQQQPAKGEKRLGLLGMRERLLLVNGRFAVKSSPGKGTTVEVEIPLQGRNH